MPSLTVFETADQMEIFIALQRELGCDKYVYWLMLVSGSIFFKPHLRACRAHERKR